MNLASREQVEGEPPSLMLGLYEDLPVGFEAEFLEAAAASGHAIRSTRISGGPFAGLELYLPSAVMLFIASSYFGGALAKIGEDHLELFKLAVSRLWKRSKALNVTTVGTAGKISSERRYGLEFSIVGIISPRIRFKLIFRLDWSEADGQDAIDAFFRMLQDLHDGTLSDDDFAALLTHKPVGGTALVTYDGPKKRIIPVDGMSR